ncbi:MAG: hypothetical protein L6437_13585, partial [Kiritimatiellae bacterium]|nr:hypothetical protein [Kiritimatiellia bacterium]
IVFLLGRIFRLGGRILAGLFAWIWDDLPALLQNVLHLTPTARPFLRPIVLSILLGLLFWVHWLAGGASLGAGDICSERRGTALLIRSWPASEVQIDGQTVGTAPARLPVNVPSGRRTIRFVSTDSTLVPVEINIDLPKNRSMELRVNLISRKWNIIDRGNLVEVNQK